VRQPAHGEGSACFRRRRGAHTPGTVLRLYAYKMDYVNLAMWEMWETPARSPPYRLLHAAAVVARL